MSIVIIFLESLLIRDQPSSDFKTEIIQLLNKAAFWQSNYCKVAVYCRPAFVVSEWSLVTGMLFIKVEWWPALSDSAWNKKSPFVRAVYWDVQPPPTRCSTPMSAAFDQDLHHKAIYYMRPVISLELAMHLYEKFENQPGCHWDRQSDQAPCIGGGAIV